MRYFIILLLSTQILFAQNKTEKPATYREVSFLTIDKLKMDEFVKVQDAISKQNYRAILPAIKEMDKFLKKFDSKATDRTFELWYIANYTDFDKQVEVARKATLASLDTYQTRLRLGTTRYFDHRLFLMQYLAFKTEVFYPEYWFMSQDRYFSLALLERVKGDNSEGNKLFTYSDFYTSFPVFDEMLEKEEADMKQYLGVDQVDSLGITDKPLIPYSYAILEKSAASHILSTFTFDDVTMDLNTDREVRALKRFIQRVRADEIYLVVRFDTVPFRNKK